MSGTYKTVQGDMWDLISYKMYGDTKFTNLLMSANKKYIEYFTFPAGIELTIPDISTKIITAAPPWKQVKG